MRFDVKSGVEATTGVFSVTCILDHIHGLVNAYYAELVARLGVEPSASYLMGNHPTTFEPHPASGRCPLD